jgi:hypothetical protein
LENRIAQLTGDLDRAKDKFKEAQQSDGKFYADLKDNPEKKLNFWHLNFCLKKGKN